MNISRYNITYIHTYRSQISLTTHTLRYMHTYIHIRTYTRMWHRSFRLHTSSQTSPTHTYTHTYIDIYIRIYIDIYIRIYIYIYTHTHIHTHTGGIVPSSCTSPAKLVPRHAGTNHESRGTLLHFGGNWSVRIRVHTHVKSEQAATGRITAGHVTRQSHRRGVKYQRRGERFRLRLLRNIPRHNQHAASE